MRPAVHHDGQKAGSGSFHGRLDHPSASCERAANRRPRRTRLSAIRGRERYSFSRIVASTSPGVVDGLRAIRQSREVSEQSGSPEAPLGCTQTWPQERAKQIEPIQSVIGGSVLVPRNCVDTYVDVFPVLPKSPNHHGTPCNGAFPTVACRTCNWFATWVAVGMA